MGLQSVQVRPSLPQRHPTHCHAGAAVLADTRGTATLGPADSHVQDATEPRKYDLSIPSSDIPPRNAEHA